MFEKGEYIIYGRNGICKIEDITHLDISGVDKKKLYYVLSPLNAKGSRVYFPVDKKDANARKLVTKQEAWKLLDEIRDIPQIWVANEKVREETYKQALNSCDQHQWVSIIKTLHVRRQTRLSQGKKMASTDERYLKLAEEALYSELAFVMDKDKSEMAPLIKEHIEKMDEKRALL